LAKTEILSLSNFKILHIKYKMDNKIILFQDKQIRRLWHNEEWYFNISDVMAALTESKDSKAYWRVLKKRLIAEGAFQSVTNCYGLKFEAVDGKKYTQDASNTEGVFRIIMSVPSPKAEPFKSWLAQVGKEYLDEMQDPEVGIDRIRENYKAKGYPEKWIERRLKSIEIRKELTDEWEKRGVKEGSEYAILTATIAKATFGLTPTEHKSVKNLTTPSQNLRDHMTNLELIFTMLGEDATRTIASETDAQGFDENRAAAHEGGESAGEARQAFEKRTKKSVISKNNFLEKEKEDNSEDLLIQ
jgi:DNA-damage-inducible protein D